MFKILALATSGLAACVPACDPPKALPACPPGEVVVWDGDPIGCDLIGGVNTLTILGLTEAECADAGGRWWYEACLDADF